MKRSFIAWIITALVLVWMPINAHAYYYVFIRYQNELSSFLQERAHVFFRVGVTTLLPVNYDSQVANYFYDWVESDSALRHFYPMYASIAEAETNARMFGPLNGILLEVSPDVRAYSLRQTISNLALVVPNQGAERRGILRFLEAARRDSPDNALVAGMPLPNSFAGNPLIQGTNIRRAVIYQYNEARLPVERNELDGPFSEGSGASAAQGYLFMQPDTPFVVRGDIVLVAPGTDNLTSFGSCGPSSSARTSAPEGHQENVCVSESISLDEFNRRHARHLGRTAPLTLLLW